ncbi:helix-turn-helix transcriptional regulator [Roseimarinus sediminis]|uniref:helix-turn-helix transcriptional regulator n=1 Tax=Roseimarinus sediminis TaxID=1610899 RepID=UPI003D1C3026
MNRIDRLNAILIQLQSKRIVKAQEIADRFEISLRTVYRDIRALEEAGIPIGAEAGIGYFLQESYHLPPVMFTSDEAAALLFGEKLIEKMSDDKIISDFCSALYKIKAILKPSEKDYLEKLHERVAVYNLNSMGDRYHQLRLFEIQDALVNKRVLRIKYEARYAGEAEWREVEPIGLCNYSSRWHLFAWCLLRKDYRDFRLDRIEELQATERNFKGKKHLSVAEYMDHISNFSTQANISILLPKCSLKLIEDSKYWYGFLSQEEDGEYLRMQFANDDLNGFAVWLLNTGSHAKVESPKELKDIVIGYVQSMAEQYREYL